MPNAVAANPVPLSLRTLPTANAQSTPTPSSQSILMGHTIQALSRASNISEEAILAALQARQQQLTLQTTVVPLQTTTTSTTTTTTTTTTPPPPPPPPRPINHLHKYPLTEPSKVYMMRNSLCNVMYEKLPCNAVYENFAVIRWRHRKYRVLRNDAFFEVRRPEIVLNFLSFLLFHVQIRQRID